MKRFLLFAAMLTALAACDKNDDGTKTPQVNDIEIQKVATGTIKYMAFNSVHVIKTDEQLEKLCDQNGIQKPAVDFSQNAVLSVAGIAPALAKNINASLKETGGKYRLDIDVNVAESEYVKPRVWSIMLQTPADVPQQIECRINYDMEFDPNQRPDSSFIFHINSDNPSQVMPLMDLDSAYAIIIKESDLEKLKGAVNDDEKCILIRYSTSYGRPVSNSIIESYISNKYVPHYNEAPSYCMAFLKNCDYDKVIAPLSDIILYKGDPISYCSGDTGMPSIAFEWPFTYVKTDDTKPDAIEHLGKALNFHNTADKMAGLYIFKSSKINILQLKYLLATEGYINTNTNYLTFPYIWKETFEHAEKETIFD